MAKDAKEAAKALKRKAAAAEASPENSPKKSRAAATAPEDEEDAPDGHRSELGHRVYVSRLPPAWRDAELHAAFEAAFGGVQEALVCVSKDDDEASLGFGFVTFTTEESRAAALLKATLKGKIEGKFDKRDPNCKRTYAVRVAAVASKDDDGDENKNICHLYQRNICPHGDACKFEHPEGQGSCLVKSETKKRPKCLAFSARGKCKNGDKCEFEHVFKEDKVAKEPKTGSGNCFNWEKKGSCRKGEKCLFSHAGAVKT
ncbi:hypothetical protein M885DRAFT_621125 [Pelagophyceae sp. CCMP2097]|nr:hypothetical protein M885DRAFT_621125 [Pelagophyceae sp. CCMP2097]